MSDATVDHRRATAERNAGAILDAAERLLAGGGTLSMAAIAGDAGVSRPTLYAHYARLADVVEAVLDRAVASAGEAVDAAELERGPADAALWRMLSASWQEIAQHDALGRAATEHLSAERMAERHGPLMARLHALVLRGQADGVFRTDLSPEWLVTACFALVHAAADLARQGHMARETAHDQLEISVRDLFAAR